MNTAPLCTEILVTLFAFPFLGAIAADAYTQIPNMICNTAQFTDGSVFDQALSKTTNNLMTVIAVGKANPFIAKSCETNLFMEAYCNESIGTYECTDCFNAIKNDINNMCKNSLGVQVTLQDCNLRYETYSFDQIEEKLKPFVKCPGTTP
ncbi:hypothetical protein MLD38_037549 [Melastoma candidum]|uniref:Uncharacterized protein n=1 Tax=Melastoma candidum TaxID=119954 RepID=A0ACB9LME3_9MYRT|nr:hypothetical protein MLD38_037549 [Melastoma candidum]